MKNVLDDISFQPDDKNVLNQFNMSLEVFASYALENKQGKSMLAFKNVIDMLTHNMHSLETSLKLIDAYKNKLLYIENQRKINMTHPKVEFSIDRFMQLRNEIDQSFLEMSKFPKSHLIALVDKVRVNKKNK